MNIDSELEPLTVYQYQVSAAMDSIVRHILATIPDSYTEEFPSFSVFETRSSWEAHVEQDGDAGGIIYCDSSLLQFPRDVTVGILAHEFAHLFLRHDGKGGLHDEWEADALASKWGFTKEIKTMRQQMDPPTDDQRQVDGQLLGMNIMRTTPHHSRAPSNDPPCHINRLLSVLLLAAESLSTAKHTSTPTENGGLTLA
jgi:hypothetical protein